LPKVKSFRPRKRSHYWCDSNKHGALLTALTGEIGLPITIDVQLAHHLPPSAGSFQIAVRTVLPFHVTSHGRPTLSENSRVIEYALLGAEIEAVS